MSVKCNLFRVSTSELVFGVNLIKSHEQPKMEKIMEKKPYIRLSTTHIKTRYVGAKSLAIFKLKL
jgi:hypothetical protein